MTTQNQNVTLNDVCSFIRGVTYSKNDESESIDGLGILRSNNVDLSSSRVNFNNIRYISNLVKVSDLKRLKSNDILMCIANGSKDLVGKVGFCYQDTNFYAGGFMAIIRPISNIIEPKFLFINLISEKFKLFLSTKNQGTNIRNLTFDGIKDYSILLPNIEMQKQITSLFQLIDTAIEQAEEQGKNLLNLKNKLLKELFGTKLKFGNYLKSKDFENISFDKIALNISERVEPKQTNLEVYVGLEHLDADNLKIERRGTPDDVIGTKLKIYKGDIIFGKRRAYLRKIAVSDFDGIASAHSMILRANRENIENDFLPYFMQSDIFMERAVQISEGSLSPTIKWKALAQQEFTLPKKEKQPKLVEIFNQFDKTLKEIKQQITTLKNLKQKLLNEILG